MRRRGTVLGLTLVVAACGIEVVGVDPAAVSEGPDGQTSGPAPDGTSSGGTSGGNSGTSGGGGNGDASKGDAKGPSLEDAGIDVLAIDSGSGCNVPLFTDDTIVAHKTTMQAMTVDGDPKEWPCTSRVRFRGDPPGGKNSNPVSGIAEAAIAWAPEGAYFMARIVTNDAPQGTNDEPWLNDAAELFFAKDPRGAIKEDDVHLIVDWQNKAKSYDKLAVAHDPDPGIKHAVKLIPGGNGFVVEAFLPKPVLKLPDISNGDSFPIDIQVDENSTGDGDRPAYWLVQKQASIDDCIEPHCNSNLWGAVRFVDP